MSQLKAIFDQLLSDASSAYIPQGAIADQILPPVKCAQMSGLLAKYGNSHLRIQQSLKAGRGSYRRVEAITRSTTSFQIEGHGLEGLVTRDDYRNTQTPYDAEKDETIGLTSMLMVEKEYALASTLGNTSTLTQNTTLSGTSQLNDYTNSDPIGVFSTARATVYSGCGVLADTAIMSWSVYNKLRYHTKLLDYLGYKYNRPGGLSYTEMAQALDVQQVLVGAMTYNSAKEGQSDSLASVWGKNIIFGVCPKAAETYQVSAGYMIVPADSTPRKVYKNPVFNPPGSTSILVEDEYDMLLSNVGALYLIKNAIA